MRAVCEAGLCRRRRRRWAERAYSSPLHIASGCFGLADACASPRTFAPGPRIRGAALPNARSAGEGAAQGGAQGQASRLPRAAGALQVSSGWLSCCAPTIRPTAYVVQTNRPPTGCPLGQSACTCPGASCCSALRDGWHGRCAVHAALSTLRCTPKQQPLQPVVCGGHAAAPALPPDMPRLTTLAAGASSLTQHRACVAVAFLYQRCSLCICRRLIKFDTAWRKAQDRLAGEHLA